MRVQNSKLWRAYSRKRASIRADLEEKARRTGYAHCTEIKLESSHCMEDPSINECLLFQYCLHRRAPTHPRQFIRRGATAALRCRAQQCAWAYAAPSCGIA